MDHYPYLFSPSTINGITLKNHIIMPPMGANVATLNDEVPQEQLEHYELRTKGGAGLITVENICIDFPFTSSGTMQLRIDNDQYIPRLFKLTEILHKHGACISVRLSYAGASAYAYHLDGQTPLSPSTTPSKKHRNTPRPMTHEETYHAVEKFSDTAERARRAGFDSAGIHVGHSYLISQFLSPLFNKRTDKFGGNVKDRTRMLNLIIDKVRACMGPRFPISLHVSADDFLEGGNTPEGSLRILELCQDKVDITNVSAAQNDDLNLQIDQMSPGDGQKRYLSHTVRDKSHKPTVIADNVRSPQMAENILASDDVDLIATGRGLIAGPEWVQKVQGGRERLMCKCISCGIGCVDHRIAHSRPLCCSINPDIIHGNACEMHRVSRETNVVVIGAGAAGMGAAYMAAEVDCHTWLLETKNHVDGLASDISRLSEKKRIVDFPQFMKNHIAPLDSPMLRVGKHAGVASVSALYPHLIINATDSTLLLSPIEGLRGDIDTADGKVSSIIGMIDSLARFTSIEDERIAVVGAGTAGLDVIEYFMARDTQVILVETRDAAGRDLDIITKNAMLAMLDERQVGQHMNAQLITVATNHFRVKNTQRTFDTPFDHSFVYLGMRANRTGLDEIERWANANNVKVMNIDDSPMTRRVIGGIRGGRSVLDTLEDMGVLGSRGAQRIPFLTY